MRKRAIAWLVQYLSRWQDRYTLLDNSTAHTWKIPGANAGAGVYRPGDYPTL